MGGGLKNLLLVVDNIPIEISLLINYFFDATHASNRMLFNGKANFRLMAAFSFLAL